MEKLDKERYLKRVIVVCWIALAICFGIKLFGGNLFEIMCENENFIKVCEYADTHIWAHYLIGSANCFISLYFFNLAIIQEYKYKWWQLLMVILTVFIGSGVKIVSGSIGLIFDIWQGFILPAIFIGKEYKKYWKILVANVLLFAFQACSFFIKNIHSAILGESTLIGLIFSIDVFIMILLYYCYCNISKKGEKNGNIFYVASRK